MFLFEGHLMILSLDNQSFFNKIFLCRKSHGRHTTVNRTRSKTRESEHVRGQKNVGLIVCAKLDLYFKAQTNVSHDMCEPTNFYFRRQRRMHATSGLSRDLLLHCCRHRHERNRYSSDDDELPDCSPAMPRLSRPSPSLPRDCSIDPDSPAVLLGDRIVKEGVLAEADCHLVAPR